MTQDLKTLLPELNPQQLKMVERLIADARKSADLDSRITGMHELVFTLRFEGIPLTEEQKASYRNYVSQLEAQLALQEQGADHE